MLKTYAIYDDDAFVVNVLNIDSDETGFEPKGIFKELDEGDSQLGLRYGASDSEIIDLHPDMSDAEVLALHTTATTSYNTLDEEKALAISMLRDACETLVNNFKCDAAPYEVATWETQRIEYSEWARDINAPIPYCRALAAGRNIPLETLMDKIHIKITRLANLQGQQHAAETAILEAPSFEILEATKAQIFSMFA